MDKTVKLRLHHLSYYTIILSYTNNDKKSPNGLQVMLALKNYVDNPPSHNSLVQTLIHTTIDVDKTVSVVKLGKQVVESSRRSTNFAEMFGRLEYYVDGIHSINREIKRIKDVELDKDKRRDGIRELKKSRSAIQRSLSLKCRALLEI